MKILVVEDDNIIAEGLRLSLTQEGYEPKVAGTKAEALKILGDTQSGIELCLLDVMLPDGTGFEICEEIRQRSDMPVLFLTACDDEVHAVLALENGADDYIVKPFHIRELMARIKAILRRTNRDAGQPAASTVYTIGSNTVDVSAAKVTRDGQEINLTAMEYRLLLILLRNRGQILERGRLLDILWDEVGDFVNDNTLTVYIKRLRAKLDDAAGKEIETVRGVGYRLR